MPENEPLTSESKKGWTLPAFMFLLGYKLTKDDGQYAEYINKAGAELTGYGRASEGKRIIQMNRKYTEGNSEHVFVGIMEDGGTRRVYNGIIGSKEYFLEILNSIR
jgi:hypothetical protein